jgi:hypothetical protein
MTITIILARAQEVEPGSQVFTQNRMNRGMESWTRKGSAAQTHELFRGNTVIFVTVFKILYSVPFIANLEKTHAHGACLVIQYSRIRY